MIGFRLNTNKKKIRFQVSEISFCINWLRTHWVERGGGHIDAACKPREEFKSQSSACMTLSQQKRCTSWHAKKKGARFGRLIQLRESVQVFCKNTVVPYKPARDAIFIFMLTAENKIKVLLGFRKFPDSKILVHMFSPT